MTAEITAGERREADLSAVQKNAHLCSKCTQSAAFSKGEVREGIIRPDIEE